MKEEELEEFIEQNRELMKAYDEMVEKLRKENPLVIVF